VSYISPWLALIRRTDIGLDTKMKDSLMPWTSGSESFPLVWDELESQQLVFYDSPWLALTRHTDIVLDLFIKKMKDSLLPQC